ncbi:MAG TPA: SRPBCC domain-containing protein [Mycobacteriales bacterium]|jgi:uncharacterized protein YndB with AHSA1/START domain|nr:hypothetical protein [Cryptosporangiaceae bacterium]MDQ1676361.1 hypothetical protein [Actinomycetota bacterium]HEV7757137.1 SRPBCC domain-containing protein [Mycobacteriales bacterium]
MTQHGRLGDFRYVIGGVAVRYERRVDAPADRVWAALTEPGELARWLGHVTIEDKAVTVRLGPDAPGGTGAVTYCHPAQMLEVDLEWPGLPPARLVAEMAELGAGRTVVVVEYRGLADEDAAEKSAQWHLRMDALAAAATGEGAPAGPPTPPADLVAAYEVHLAELRQVR